MIIRLMSLVIVLAPLLSSCATPHHTVRTDLIKNSEEKVFRIGTIKVPCKLQCLPTLSPYKSKEQLRAARNANPQEVLKVLSELYGLRTAVSVKLEEESYPVHFTGLVLADAGRCHYLENAADKENDNIVDIYYDIFAVCLPGQTPRATLTYRVVVRSKGEVLIEHEDKIAAIDFGPRWLGNGDIDRIVDTAKEIPSTLRKDITNTRKAQPEGAANSATERPRS